MNTKIETMHDIHGMDRSYLKKYYWPTHLDNVHKWASANSKLRKNKLYIDHFLR